ncbi:MAG: MarR family transcriptional regulator [Candidatus Pelethousia sp.]|nr:MarR family transcriptional regulator [Candidatus Pelethousia sp.]
MQVSQDMDTINQLYKQLSQRADRLYQFVLLYSEYINGQHDYGEGHIFTMLEIHVLTYIQDHPGITPTELAKVWCKTKGAISQTITKLAAQGYVYKEKKDGNMKAVHLYTTPEGDAVSNMHKAYDVADIVQTLQDLQRSCSQEDIDAFYKVLDAYTKLLQH